MMFKLEQMPINLHPAYVAWEKLRQNGKEPTSIELLTKRNGKPHNEKSRIYRLSGAGFDDNAVIAKRAPLTKLGNERSIYEKVLPYIPVPSLHFYGLVADSDNKLGWIFLDSGEGSNYSEEKLEDRTLAAKWLGLFHSFSSQINNDCQLNDHGADQYYDYIRAGRIRLSTSLTKPFLRSSDIKLLNEITLNFEIIDSRWADISQLCDQMPRCVVHGDFISKNITISPTGKERQLNVFDWECAGWGVPAVDLGGLDFTFGSFEGRDLASYEMSIKQIWPNFGTDAIRQWVNLGLIFRYLAWIATTILGVNSEWHQRPMRDLEGYHASLTAVLNELKWN